MAKFIKVPEAAEYLGYTKSYLYKLIQAREIPFYRPNGRICLFKQEELDLWIEKGRVKTNEELIADAQAYMIQHDIIDRHKRSRQSRRRYSNGD